MMIGNIKSPSNYCKFCGWEFQNDIIQKIIEEQESAVCEFCGIEINISSISPQEGNIKENYERISNSKDKVEKKKKSIVKSISKLTKTKKYSVNVIMGDKDFPKIFKENLIVVISRLIYKNIREWEQDNDVNIHQVGLTQSILITLAKKVKPIIGQRIHNSYLENLHKITPEEFEEWLKLLQKKLRSIQEYRKHFIIYLLWLTKLVFRLVSDMWEMKNLPKFQATILKDLKEYDFDFLIFKNNCPNKNEIRTIKSLIENKEHQIEKVSNPKRGNYRYEYRILVEQIDLANVFKVLKGKGYSIQDVKKLTNFDFKYALYQGGSIHTKSFKKLETLIGYPIPHSIKEPIIKPCILLESEDLAELTGVLLGDGNISKDHYTISITLNQIEEPNYVNYIKNLIKSTLKQEPSVVDLLNNKAIQLRIYNTGIIEGLLSKGLKSGNKVKNQVGVPLWIKKNHRFIIPCLKGLIDTDGSIYIARRENSIHINFKNNSKPLVEDFRDMCDTLQIRASKVHSGWTHSRGKRFRHFKVSICAKEQAAKFIYIVNPMKWNFRLKKFKNFLKTQGLSIEDVFKYKRERNQKYYCQKVIERLREIE